MKNLMMVVAAIALGVSAQAGTKTLALSEYTIELPANPRASQKLAARELEDALTRATGHKAATNGSARFVLGRAPEGAKRAPSFVSLSERRGNTIYLWGDDASAYPGTLYAVYGFLAKRLGVVWAYPGQDGCFAPKRATLDFPEGACDVFEPRYAKGIFRSMFVKGITHYQENLPSELRWTDAEAQSFVDDLNVWHRRHRLYSREDFQYGHAFTGWQRRFLKTHPEYLSLRDDGTRIGLKWQDPSTIKLCVSNPNVVDQILADWKVAGTNRYLNVCENDGWNYCVCPKCKALDTDLPGEDFNRNKTDRYLWFWNRIAEKARQIRPDVQIVAYIYSSYRFPPRRERIEYPENMCFGIVPTFTDDIRTFLGDWGKAGLKRFFLRPNWHCSFGVLPRGVEKMVYDTYAYCCRHGLMGVDFDTDFGRYVLRPENYVTCRMIAEPERSFETFMDEFCSAFGEAKDDVAAYYAGIRDRVASRRSAVNAEARKGIMLDDSEMARFQTRYHTEAELLSDVALLEKAAERTFADPLCSKRTRDLVVFARHYVLTWRFLDAAGAKDEARLAALARELADYRIAHQDILHDYYGMNMAGNWRGLENRIWKGMQAKPWEVRTFFADPERGDDGNDGLTAKTAFRTLAKAASVLKPGDTLELARGAVFHDVLGIRTSGTAIAPITVHGNGAILSGNKRVPDDGWRDCGAGLWFSTNDCFYGACRPRVLDAKGELVSLPVSAPAFKDPKLLKPGEAVWNKAGIWYRAVGGAHPKTARLSGFYRQEGVVLENVHHLVFTDLTAENYSNDGFNIHGLCRGLVFRNIVARWNGDDGFSVHEDVDAKVYGLYTHHNDYGIQDIGRAQSSFVSVLSEENRLGGVDFYGGMRTLRDAVVRNNGGLQIAFRNSFEKSKNPDDPSYDAVGYLESVRVTGGDGAALTVYGGARVTATDCHFSNAATGVRVDGGRLHLASCTVEKCPAPCEKISGGRLTLSNCHGIAQ